MKSRPKGMDYGVYKAACAATKTAPMDEDAFKALPVDEDEPIDGAADPEEEATDDDTTGGEEGDGEPVSKGLADLRKSLEAFGDVQNAAQTAIGGSRETYLSARASAGTITKSERAELGRIWAGAAEDRPVDASGRVLHKSLREALDPADQDVIDAAPLFKGLMNGIQDALNGIQHRIDAGQVSNQQIVLAQGQLLKSLCGGILDLADGIKKRDKLIKGLTDRLDAVERTPVGQRAVRAAGDKGAVAAPLNKSTTGARSNTGAGGARSEQLSKAVVVRGFNMLVKSAADQGDFATAKRLSHECADYELHGQLLPGTQAAIKLAVS